MGLYDHTKARNIPYEVFNHGMGQQGQGPIETCNAPCPYCTGSYNLHGNWAIFVFASSPTGQWQGMRWCVRSELVNLFFLVGKNEKNKTNKFQGWTCTDNRRQGTRTVREAWVLCSTEKCLWRRSILMDERRMSQVAKAKKARQAPSFLWAPPWRWDGRRWDKNFETHMRIYYFHFGIPRLGIMDGSLGKGPRNKRTDEWLVIEGARGVPFISITGAKRKDVSCSRVLLREGHIVEWGVEMRMVLHKGLLLMSEGHESQWDTEDSRESRKEWRQEHTVAAKAQLGKVSGTRTHGHPGHPCKCSPK